MFERKGIITIPKGNLNPEEFELEIIDAGVEDFEVQDDGFVDYHPIGRLWGGHEKTRPDGNRSRKCGVAADPNRN
jgi:transcriptional/translational regulatory protein YebC/TACO1